MNRDSFRDLIIKGEGLRLKPYLDIVGKVTIGYGRCLDDVGISNSEAQMMLDNDLSRVVGQCRTNFLWFNDLTDNRQNVVASMVYNLGLDGFKNFKRVVAAIAACDWEGAAEQMLASKWAAQVGKRATELANFMRSG